MTSQTTLPVKALTASNEVAHLVGKAKKPHTIAESLIRPAAMAICRTSLDISMQVTLNKFHYQTNTISRRITEIATNVKCQMLIERIRNGFFSLKLDESTDILNSSQLIVFVSYRHERKLLENLLFCSALEKTCKGRDFLKNSMVN